MLRQMVHRLRRQPIVCATAVGFFLSLALLAYNVENVDYSAATYRRRSRNSDRLLQYENAAELLKEDKVKQATEEDSDFYPHSTKDDSTTIELKRKRLRRRRRKQPQTTVRVVEKKIVVGGAESAFREPYRAVSVEMPITMTVPPIQWRALGAESSNTVAEVEPKAATEAESLNVIGQEIEQQVDVVHDFPRWTRSVVESGSSLSTFSSTLSSTTSSDEEERVTPPRRRIVHFDLKGAPPKVDYLKRVFRLIASMGATGVLMEWEDMFPFSGRLRRFVHENAYSVKDVRDILECAYENNLEVIPLIQTFGHLEWLLKHDEFRHLREVDRYSQTICPSKVASIDLLHELIDQMLKLHGNATFVHIGCDEAYQIGFCNECSQRLSNDLENDRSRLLIAHIASVAKYVRDRYKKNVLIWHDMLLNIDPQTIRNYDLGNLVEPVLWAYAERVGDYVTNDTWNFLANMSSFAWGASAFKGADGPDRWWSNIPHYLNNHNSWLKQMSIHSSQFSGEFRGLILTGWSRFDHFAILCELLPVGIPSLAVSLRALSVGATQSSSHVIRLATKDLECTDFLSIESKGAASNPCGFPGFQAYLGVQQLRVSFENIDEQFVNNYQARGWFAPYQLRRNYSSSWYLDKLNDLTLVILSELRGVVTKLKADLEEIYFEETVDEFLEQVVGERFERMLKIQEFAKGIAAKSHFARRPQKGWRARFIDELTTTTSTTESSTTTLVTLKEALSEQISLREESSTASGVSSTSVT